MLKRSSKSKGGQYPTAFKIKAIKRVERGEGVLPVARDLGVTRKALHDWVRAWKLHGPEGLNRKRGPKPGRKKLRLSVLENASKVPAADRDHEGDRIAALERVIGRQQLELDFFRQALRALDGTAAQGKPRRVSKGSSKT